MFKPTLKFRSQLLIDHQIQWPVLQRTAFYVSACALYFMVVLYFSESTQINDESISRTLLRCADVLACWAPGLVLLAPIIAYDILIFTNRFAGPMFRLRREMQALIDGECEQPIKLRDDDFWIEFASLFNEIRSELTTLRELNSSSPQATLDELEPDSTDETSGDSRPGGPADPQSIAVGNADAVPDTADEPLVDAVAPADQEQSVAGVVS